MPPFVSCHWHGVSPNISSCRLPSLCACCFLPGRRNVPMLTYQPAGYWYPFFIYGSDTRASLAWHQQQPHPQRLKPQRLNPHPLPQLLRFQPPPPQRPPPQRPQPQPPQLQRPQLQRPHVQPPHCPQPLLQPFPPQHMSASSHMQLSLLQNIWLITPLNTKDNLQYSFR